MTDGGAEPDADVDAAGDHRLQRLGAAIGIAQLKCEPALAEHAGILAEFRRRSLPLSALAERDLDGILGGRGLCGHDERENRE